MGILLAVLFAVIAFCGYLLFDAVMIDKKRQESLRARITPDGQVGEIHDETAGHLSRDPSPQGRMILGWLRALGVQVDITVPKLGERLAQAGISSADAPAYYLFFERIVSVLICSVLLLLAFNHEGGNKLLFYGLLAFIAAAAVFGPSLYLQNKAEHRRMALQRAFPDTLDLMLICVEAGLALDAALNRICGELSRAYPEMTEELNRTRLELSLLNDRVQALTNLANRTNMTAFRSLVSSLVQSERFGTSLTDTLRVLAEDFRLQRMADAESRAARIPVLMTIPLMLLLMPAFMLIVLGPAIVSIVHAINR